MVLISVRSHFDKHINEYITIDKHMFVDPCDELDAS